MGFTMHVFDVSLSTLLYSFHYALSLPCLSSIVFSFFPPFCPSLGLNLIRAVHKSMGEGLFRGAWVPASCDKNVNASSPKILNCSYSLLEGCGFLIPSSVYDSAKQPNLFASRGLITTAAQSSRVQFLILCITLHPCLLGS